MEKPVRKINGEEEKQHNWEKIMAECQRQHEMSKGVISLFNGLMAWAKTDTLEGATIREIFVSLNSNGKRPLDLSRVKNLDMDLRDAAMKIIRFDVLCNNGPIHLWTDEARIIEDWSRE